MDIEAPVNRTPGRKVLMSLAAIGIAVGVAGVGSWAAFASSTPAIKAVGGGTVLARLDSADSPNSLVTIEASRITPGESSQRTVTLRNAGTLNWASAALTVTATTSSLLDTDATNGLQLVIDACSVPWNKTGVAASPTYTCTGATTSVVASRPVIGTSPDLDNLASLTAGAHDNLRVTLTLPATADNRFQGRSSTIALAFAATQGTTTDS